MRPTTALLLCLALGLVLRPGVARADDAPSAKQPAALPAPSEAWSQVQREAMAVHDYAQRRAAIQKGARAYLEAFAKQGRMALGAEALSLGYLQQAAEQWVAAAGSFRSVWGNADLEAGLRDQGALQEARLLANSSARAALGAKACHAAVEGLLAQAKTMEGETRAKLRSSVETYLGYALDAEGRKPEAYALRLTLVNRDPTRTSAVARSLVSDLLGRSHAMADYDGMRADAKTLVEMLTGLQKRAAEMADAQRDEALANLKKASPDSLDASGHLVQKPVRSMTALERVAWNARRRAEAAHRAIDRVASAGAPFEMLGKPVPDWTLVHAFGKVKSIQDLRGKVVVMDFWATWCPWCVRSFPAIREVLREDGPKGLAFVGVTTTASSVYAARYRLDSDLEGKAPSPGYARPTARLARGSMKPDGVTVFDAATYPAKEQEVLATFIHNHEMTWPVVMIDKEEPMEKYALTGWPHAVILDRQGRVRAFKSGALLRDHVEAYKAFRKLLDDLLAEPAPDPKR
jgi:thiol-disulfide isomerase/thioredoxin